MKACFLLSLVLTTLISPSVCWWDTGHMAVAKIASLVLKEKNLPALSLAENITEVLNPYSHNLVTNFVESACWADDVRNNEYLLIAMTNWHYIDVEIRLNQTHFEPILPFCPNCADIKLTELLTTLNSWSMNQVHDVSHQMEKSIALRFITHIIGDIHQPLHAASLFDSKLFPNGDEGGNLFLIKFEPVKEINQLHKFFDSGAAKLKEFTRPLNATTNKDLEEICSTLIQKQNRTLIETVFNEEVDHHKWIKESAEISFDHVYRNITFNGTVTNDYWNQSIEVVEKRLVLGGVRLAKIISNMYFQYENTKKNHTREVINNSLKFLS